MFPCIVVTIETTLQKKEYSFYILLYCSVKCIFYFTGELCHNIFIQLWNSGWLVGWLVGWFLSYFSSHLNKSVSVVTEAVQFSKTRSKPL